MTRRMSIGEGSMKMTKVVAVRIPMLVMAVIGVVTTIPPVAISSYLLGGRVTLLPLFFMKSNLIKINTNPDLFLIKLPHKSEYAYLDIVFCDAVLTESAGKYGIAHFLEHCICETLYQKFGDKFSINGGTGIRDLSFRFNFKKNDFTEFSLKVLELILNIANINPDIFDKEKKVILDEISNRAHNGADELSRLKNGILFKKPRRFQYLFYELAEDIKMLTIKDINDQWKKVMKNASVKIFIGANKFNPGYNKLCADLLQSVKFNNNKRNSYKVEYKKGVNLIVNNWAYDKKINFSITFPGLTTRYSPKQIVALIAALKLLMGKSDFGVFKESRNLGVYGIYFNNIFTWNYGIITLTAKVSAENFYQILDLLKQKIRNLMSANVSKSKIAEIFNLEMIKSNWKENINFYRDATNSVIEKLEKLYSPKEIVSFIKKLTPSDIKKAAELLDLSNAKIAVLTSNLPLDKKKILSVLK